MTTNLPRRAPDNSRLSSGALVQQAVQFTVAADAYFAASKGREWMVLYFQFAQAIELAAKAFAIHSGETERTLRGISHDLVAALALAEKNGLGLKLTAGDRAALKMLSAFHTSAVLRYPQVGMYSFPRPRIMRLIVDGIVAAAFKAIMGEARYDVEIRRNALGLCITPAIDSWGEE